MNSVSTPKKRLLFIAYSFPPNAEAGTHRSFRFVKYLRKLDWEVVVLTADPEDYLPGTPVDVQCLKVLPPDLEVIRSSVFRGLSKAIRFRDFLKKFISKEQKKPSAYRSTPNNGRQMPSRFQMIKDLITTPFSIPDTHIGWLWGSLIRGRRAMRGRPFDLIYSSAPPWTSHLIAYTLSKLSGVPFVADFRDPWARNPWKLGRNKAQKFMAEFLEKAVVQQARFTILNTDWARKEYRLIYENIAPERFQLIPNGYDSEDFAGIKAIPSSRGDSFHVVHAGSLYGGRDPVPLFRAWALFIQGLTSNKDRLLLSLIGVGGQQRDELKKIVSHFGLDQYVDLVPRVPHREALNIMAGADLLLILQGGTSLCVPAKLFEYMALSKPTLGLASAGAAADILELYPLGRIVKPDDPEEISAGILAFFDERKNALPREEISDFIAKYRAFDLTRELDLLLHRAIAQKKS